MGMSVRQYHESGGKWANHVKTEHVGPKAMHRPIMYDQMHAETTKRMFIGYDPTTYVPHFWQNPKKRALIKNNYISKNAELI